MVNSHDYCYCLPHTMTTKNITRTLTEDYTRYPELKWYRSYSKMAAAIRHIIINPTNEPHDGISK